MGDPARYWCRQLFIVVPFMAHAAPSVLPSHEDNEDEVMGSMWVILHHSAITEKSQLVAVEDRTWDHRLRTAAR